MLVVAGEARGDKIIVASTVVATQRLRRIKVTVHGDEKRQIQLDVNASTVVAYSYTGVRTGTDTVQELLSLVRKEGGVT